MTFVEWLQFVYAICTSGEAPANWRELAIYSNGAIAVAYFWIPLVMAAVFWRWRDEIPFPWIWTGFVLFITACGTSHIVHALHAVSEQTPYSYAKLSVLVATALISLATATGFTLILPRIMALASPSAARQRLEQAVELATADLEHALSHEKLLLRELHHRVKNNLQITASLVSLEKNRQARDDSADLSALHNRILAMAEVHAQFREVGARSFSFRDFVTSLGDKLQHGLGRIDLRFEVEGPDFEVSLDQATSLAVLFNEIMTTAFKSAGRSDRIKISLETTPEGHRIELTGAGAGLRTLTEGKGTERSLISSLIIQLNAMFEIEDTEDGRTRLLLLLGQPHSADRSEGAVEPLSREKPDAATKPAQPRKAVQL